MLKNLTASVIFGGSYRLEGNIDITWHFQQIYLSRLISIVVSIIVCSWSLEFTKMHRSPSQPNTPQVKFSDFSPTSYSLLLIGLSEFQILTLKGHFLLK